MSKLAWLSKSAPFILSALILAAFSYMLFFRLGVHPLVDWDEGIYAQVARESFENGNQLGFTWLGRAWHEKPPVMIWLTEAGYAIFGVNELGARFFSTLFAFGAVVLSFIYCWRVFKSPWAGALSVATWFTAFQFINEAFYGGVNTASAFWLLLALLAWAIAKEKPRWYYLFFVAVGMGVMTKSVIGLLPVVVVGAEAAITRDWRFLRQKVWYWAGLVFLLLVVPWHVIMSVKFGKAFWDSYLFYHVLERFTTTLETNGGGKFFYLEFLWTQKVLSVLFAGSIVYFAAKLWRSSRYLLPLLTCAVILLVLSFSQTKGSPYLTIIYPFVVTMVAVTLFELLSFSPWRVLKHGSMLVLVIAFMFMGKEYNAYKIIRAEGNPEYEGGREMGHMLATLPATAEVFATHDTHVWPALQFYANRRIPNASVELTAELKAKILGRKPDFHVPGRSLYRVGEVYLLDGESYYEVP